MDDWKRRFQLHGLVVDRLLALALDHLAYGCNRLEAMLALAGPRVSSITIQKILNAKRLYSREQRLAGAGREDRERADRAHA